MAPTGRIAGQTNKHACKPTQIKEAMHLSLTACQKACHNMVEGLGAIATVFFVCVAEFV